MAGPEFHPLRVAAVRREGDDALVLQFDVPARLQALFNFEAGQHLTLRQGQGAVDVRRSYSLCAAPGQGLRVGVRRVAGGQFSNWLHAQARPGLVLDVMPPQGRFGAALQRPAPGGRHVLGLAAGSGITPILSIVQTVLASEPHSHCSLLYGNRSAASAMFIEELAGLKNRYLGRLAVHHVFSREDMALPLYGGRLDGARIGRLLGLARPVDEAFICGPHGFDDMALAALRAQGLRAECVHVERFGVPPEARSTPEGAGALDGADEAQREIRRDEQAEDRAEEQADLRKAASRDVPTERQNAPAGAASRITLLRDGVAREINFDPADGSVLLAARRAGLELPYACQSGVCATCRARCTAGRATMARNFALEPAEVAAGWVLTCQARPLDGPLTLDFDAR